MAAAIVTVTFPAADVLQKDLLAMIPKSVGGLCKNELPASMSEETIKKMSPLLASCTTNLASLTTLVTEKYKTINSKRLQEAPEINIQHIVGLIAQKYFKK